MGDVQSIFLIHFCRIIVCNALEIAVMWCGWALWLCIELYKALSQKMDCDLEYFQRVSLFVFPVEKATSTSDALLKQINARLTSITSLMILRV